MKTKAPKCKYKTVMLIDDNEIDNFINEKLIKAYLFAENVYVHTSTKSALEFLKNLEVTLATLPDDLIPSHILLDINMPILDGFHFLEEFEKFSDRLKEKIKIIMLTTSMNPMDIEKSKTSKYVGKFLHKPLTEADLMEL
ncbi:MAG: response regulator receiver [Bacteroidota bacterium]|jgi:CheY-like chemotaxis protein|nr:response regulator receiver [Bacteroidota bacterium]